MPIVMVVSGFFSPVLSIPGDTFLELTQRGTANNASKASAKHCTQSPQRSRSGMVDAEMERLQLLLCRNLSLIVPLYCLGESLLKTESNIGVPHLCSNAASNETYSDCPVTSSGLQRMEVQLPS